MNQKGSFQKNKMEEELENPEEFEEPSAEFDEYIDDLDLD